MDIYRVNFWNVSDNGHILAEMQDTIDCFQLTDKVADFVGDGNWYEIISETDGVYDEVYERRQAYGETLKLVRTENMPYGEPGEYLTVTELVNPQGLVIVGLTFSNSACCGETTWFTGSVDDACALRRLLS